MNDKLGLDSEGKFYRGRKLLEFEGKIEGTIGVQAIVPGIDFCQLLKAHVTKRVKIIIEVIEES